MAQNDHQCIGDTVGSLNVYQCIISISCYAFFMESAAQTSRTSAQRSLVREENPSAVSARRSATERWGAQGEWLFKDGWLSVPTKFLRSYAEMNPPLSPGEALFVLQLMTFKWDAAAPFPSYGRIAKAMGVTDKMVRRYAQSLQKKQYLIRQYQSHAPNKFDLTRLFDALAEVPQRPPNEEKVGVEDEKRRRKIPDEEIPF